MIGKPLFFSAIVAALGAAGSTAAQAPPRPSPGWYPFAAIYDGDAPVLIRGKVVSVDASMRNVLVHMIEDGTGVSWVVEGGAAATLARGGILDRLTAGTPVVVRGYLAKDKRCTPECRANGRDITLPNGMKAFLGVAGACAPAPSADGRAPNACATAPGAP